MEKKDLKVLREPPSQEMWASTRGAAATGNAAGGRQLPYGFEWLLKSCCCCFPGHKPACSGNPPSGTDCNSDGIIFPAAPGHPVLTDHHRKHQAGSMAAPSLCSI